MKSVELVCWIALSLLVAPACAQMTATTRTTSDGRPLASSLPPPKGQQVRMQPRPLAFEELSRHLGDRIILTTIYGKHVEGLVDSVSGQTLRLRISAGHGFAVTNFERAKIRSMVTLS